MTFAQYCRIEKTCGGVAATNREFIKACRDYILPQARTSRLYRVDRHNFYREGLKMLEQSKRDFFKVNIGNFK